MPPPKKAAKKATKKAAKKAAKKHAPHHEDHHERKDLLRSFEHMGRIDILDRFADRIKAPGSNSVTHALANLAQSELHSGRRKQAADLLRGAEHWTFATLAAECSETTQVGAELNSAITEQFEDLLSRATDHWEDGLEPSAMLAAIYDSARKAAVKAFHNAHYFQALEFSRAAEAISHGKSHGPLKLKQGEKIPRTDWKLAG
jgi:hypothetical protein